MMICKGSFNKRAGFQSLGKFLFAGLFCIVFVSLNIPIVASVWISYISSFCVYNVLHETYIMGVSL